MEEHDLWQHVIRPKPRIAVAVWPLSTPIFFSCQNHIISKLPLILVSYSPIHPSDPQRPLLSRLLFFSSPAWPERPPLPPQKTPPPPQRQPSPTSSKRQLCIPRLRIESTCLQPTSPRPRPKKKKKKKASGLTQSRSRKQYPFGTKVPSLQQHASMPEISPLRKSLALRGRGGGGVRWRRRGHFLALWPSGSFGFFGVPRSLVIFLQNTFMPCLRLGSFLSR